MRIISFGWTMQAFLSGHKTVTRRDWADRHGQSYKLHQQLQAWDKLPRAGGQRIGTIELTEVPFKQSTADAPDTDWDAEGFQWMAEHNLLVADRHPADVWATWQRVPEVLWVVRFKVIETVLDFPPHRDREEWEIPHWVPKVPA